MYLVPTVSMTLGSLVSDRDDYNKAKRYLKEALDLTRKIDQRLLIVAVLCEWGEYYLRQRKLNLASASYLSLWK